MDLKRLFQVLVVGGQMMGCTTERSGKLLSADASGDTEDAAAEENDDAPTEIADTGAEETTDAADATTAPDAGSVDMRGSPCFCNIMPTCCQVHDDGTKAPVAGVECCWGTSC